MSINPKSEQKKVKLSAKRWNWVQNGEIKVIDSSYFELGQTKLRTKLNKDWNSLSNYLITKQIAKLNNNN